MCAKNYENPTMLSWVTAKNVGDVFFETHCIYDNFNLVALFWTFSIASASPLLYCDHTDLAYSRSHYYLLLGAMHCNFSCLHLKYAYTQVQHSTQSIRSFQGLNSEGGWRRHSGVELQPLQLWSLIIFVQCTCPSSLHAFWHVKAS